MTDDEDTGISLDDILTTLGKLRRRDTPEGDEIVIITDWTVKSDGRLTIPSDKREKYGIEEGDDIDAILRVEGEGDGGD